MRRKVRWGGGKLPGEVTSFVGRREATAEVKRVLQEARLVTLVGVGGVGKSRLALHVVTQLRRAFPDGIYLVELAKVQDPSMVPAAVAAALGLLDQSARDPESVLVGYLRGKQPLILLDNCEQVLHAAGQLVHALLLAVPGLRVLTTSREPLRIEAEHVWQVAPLSVPADSMRTPLTGRDSWRSEAVELFEDRAAAVRPGFAVGPDNAEAVIRLSQRLDGVPLALELAAVHMRSLSVEQILARLERRFELLTTGSRSPWPHHQTLRAAVDYSYELCTEQERLLWARCSVFTGEFEIDAVEDVCRAPGADHDIYRYRWAGGQIGTGSCGSWTGGPVPDA